RWINSRAAVVRRDDAGLPARVVGTHLDLTEQRAFESALHDKQEKLAGLFRIAPIGIAMAIQRVLIEVNDTFCGLTGYRRDELVGRETRILYLDQTEYERVARFKYRTGSQDGINEVDTRWVRKDGTAIDVVLNATPLDRQDPARGITFTVLDVTGRRRIEAALRESEEAYRLAMDATQDGVWDWDIATGAVRYSPAWFKIVEAVPGPPHYDSWATRVHPDDWPEVQRTLSEHLAGRDTLWHREHRLRLPSGDWKWVLGRGRVVKRDKTGQPLRMVGTMADISERKAAERERALLSDTLEASLNEIYLFDAESFRFRYVNEGGLRNLGYSRDAIRQLTPLDIKPYLTPAHFQELVAPLLSGERKVQVFESRHRRADGSLYPVDVHLQLFRQDGEGVYLAVIQDTTERKRTEASLKASEERFRLWVEATDSVFWVADRAGALSQPSHSLERLTGLSREQCLGHGRLTAIHPDDRDAYATALARAVARGDAFELQLRYWDAGGNAYRWYLERVVPHRSDDGTVRGWLGAGVAIDRQKRAEAAQQDMLRRKDEFIAMLGHELRNPLAPIRN
ncbi:MAG: PAS domain S-box protein, partial [Gammaproteobacteria bacterium]|nr:PAS domain S-box protein [Gammaproteobacteria bacterium]